MNLKRLVALPLVLALACTLGLAGCGEKSVEEQVRADLEEQFSKISASDDDLIDAVDSAVEAAVGEGYSKLGVSTKDFMSAFLDGFEYQVGDVSVDDTGKTATGQVGFKMKSVEDVKDAFTTKWASEASGLSGASGDELYAKAGEVLLSCIKDAKPSEHTVNVEYEKEKDGDWDPKDDIEETLVAAMTS